MKNLPLEQLERMPEYSLLYPICECSGVATDEAVTMAMHLSKHSLWTFRTWALTIRSFISTHVELPDIEDEHKYNLACKYGILFTKEPAPKVIQLGDWGAIVGQIRSVV